MSLLQLLMKAGDGSELGLEDYIQQIQCRGQLGMLELMLFIRCLDRWGDKNLSQMYYQIWQAADQPPMVLWYAPEASQDAANTSTLPVPSLKLVTLPESKQPVWLPLTRAGNDHKDGADVCQQRLQALDKSLAARAEAAAEAKQPPVKQPAQSLRAQPRVLAIRRKLRSYCPTAQPAESSGSVIRHGKRGPSPDNDSPGKAARTG